MRPERTASRQARAAPSFKWDYRWMGYPARGRVVTHPHDGAVQTFRGHTVMGTLIRAYWSPLHTTGQRYIYTGSYDGMVHIYGARGAWGGRGAGGGGVRAGACVGSVRVGGRGRRSLAHMGAAQKRPPNPP